MVLFRASITGSSKLECLKNALVIFGNISQLSEVILYFNSDISYTFGIKLAFYTESAFSYM
jgi:hypothetical protein